MDGRRVLKTVDKPFVITLLIILVMGLVVLTSANAAVSAIPLYYVKRQLVGIGLGAVAALAIIRIDYSQFSRFSGLIYLLTILMLLAVLFLGKEVRGTTGWIALGSMRFQPAELAKIMIVISFADFLSRRQGELNTLKELLPCFLYVLVPFLLILAQPDMGTGLVILALILGMMFVAGANPKLLVQMLLVAVGLVALALFLHFQFGMWLPLKDYQMQRLIVFIDPYNDGMGGRGWGWNTIQSLVAIGSGGFFGKGLFCGTQVQLNFLPELHTDFIYAVIGEELGFLGAAFLVILYGILIYRAIHIAYAAKDLFGTLIVVGIATMWLFHIFENIGMSIGIMPITGIPLPFVSYGGSAMLANLIGVGLILAVNLKGNRALF
ncbi:MAG: rod shape-determining protein RodA [Syntrophomonadaceae bacterium]|jgi:rod shape determining protein RodA|nr:rod shape-determining protein RodA [Syntrophomonadaceae bacterium]